MGRLGVVQMYILLKSQARNKKKKSVKVHKVISFLNLYFIAICKRKC